MKLKDLKDKITFKDYEIAKKYLNKYVLFSILSGFGLGILVDEMRKKNESGRKK